MKNKLQKINKLKKLKVLKSNQTTTVSAKKCPGSPDIWGKYLDENQ